MIRSGFGRIVASVVLGLTLLPGSSFAQGAPSFRSPTQQELSGTKSGGKDWITYGGAVNNERYSSLNAVTPANVQNLKGAWMTRLGSGPGAKYRLQADPRVTARMLYTRTA